MPDKPSSEQLRHEAEKLRDTATDLMEHAALLIAKSIELEKFNRWPRQTQKEFKVGRGWCPNSALLNSALLTNFSPDTLTSRDPRRARAHGYSLRAHCQGKRSREIHAPDSGTQRITGGQRTTAWSQRQIDPVACQPVKWSKLHRTRRQFEDIISLL